MKTHNWNIAVATLAATLFAAAALSAHTSVSVSIGVPAPVVVAPAPAPVVVAAPAPAPVVVAQAPATAQVVVAAPAPVPATVVVQQPVYYPEYYTWDGFEYVGVIGGNYFYLGAGNMWIACEPWRAHRFHEWEHYHQDWHRRAIHNEHYRHGPPPPPRR